MGTDADHLAASTVPTSTLHEVFQCRSEIRTIVCCSFAPTNTVLHIYTYTYIPCYVRHAYILVLYSNLLYYKRFVPKSHSLSRSLDHSDQIMVLPPSPPLPPPAKRFINVRIAYIFSPFLFFCLLVDTAVLESLFRLSLRLVENSRKQQPSFIHSCVHTYITGLCKTGYVLPSFPHPPTPITFA